MCTPGAEDLEFSGSVGGECWYVDWHSSDVSQEREDELSRKGRLGVQWTDDGFLHLYLTRQAKSKNAFCLMLDGDLAQDLFEMLKEDLGK